MKQLFPHLSCICVSFPTWCGTSSSQFFSSGTTCKVDENGRKMSKSCAKLLRFLAWIAHECGNESERSIGNVIDPRTIIEGGKNQKLERNTFERHSMFLIIALLWMKEIIINKHISKCEDRRHWTWEEPARGADVLGPWRRGSTGRSELKAHSGYASGLLLWASQAMYPLATISALWIPSILSRSVFFLPYACQLGLGILKSTEENVRRLRNRARFVKLARLQGNWRIYFELFTMTSAMRNHCRFLATSMTLTWLQKASHTRIYQCLVLGPVRLATLRWIWPNYIKKNH